MNKILEAFAAGRPPIGTFSHLKSLAAVESLGCTGLDYVVLDTEHCSAGSDFTASALTAAGAAGIAALVRINEIARSAVLQPLDAGADGIIVPNVETPAQVRDLVRWAKFPPLGGRGYCPTRDGGWGYGETARAGAAFYMEHCNRQTLLLPQCETRGCLERIGEIAAIDGVDGIFVGPLDLSIALGCPMRLDAPEMQDAMKRIHSACAQAGTRAFLFCADAQTAAAQLAAGFDSAAVGVDVMLHIQTYRTLVEDIQQNL